MQREWRSLRAFDSIKDHRLLVEPSCGASLAALYNEAGCRSDKQNILAVVCGGVGATSPQLEQWDRALNPVF